MNKAVFLDRDGVVIEQVHYLGTPDGVKLETNAAKAIKLLHDNGFLAIVINLYISLILSLISTIVPVVYEQYFIISPHKIFLFHLYLKYDFIIIL